MFGMPKLAYYTYIDNFIYTYIHIYSLTSQFSITATVHSSLSGSVN